jgi:hypothetical protein
MAEATDLVLERVLDAPRELVWRAMTTPEHLKRWWAPRPYQTTECEIDLRPGGAFRTRMVGPEASTAVARAASSRSSGPRGSRGPTPSCPATGRPAKTRKTAAASRSPPS